MGMASPGPGPKASGTAGCEFLVIRDFHFISLQGAIMWLHRLPTCPVILLAVKIEKGCPVYIKIYPVSGSLGQGEFQ